MLRSSDAQDGGKNAESNLPSQLQAGVSVFGKPTNHHEQHLMQRAMRALEFSKNPDNLRLIVEREKDLAAVDEGRFKAAVEDLTGHKFETAKLALRDIRQAVVEGSEQRWMLWGWHEPLKKELVDLDRRLAEAGSKAGIRVEERVPCSMGPVRQVVFGRAYRIEELTVDKRGLLGTEITEELEKAERLFAQASEKCMSEDPFEIVNAMMLVELLAGSGGTVQDPKNIKSHSKVATWDVPSAASRIRTEGITLDHALNWTSTEMAEKMRSVGDATFAARADDILMAAKYGVQMLSGKTPEEFAADVIRSLKSNTVIAVDKLDAPTAKAYVSHLQIFAVIAEEQAVLRGHVGKTFADAGKVATSVKGGLLTHQDMRTGEPLIIDTTLAEPVIIIAPTVDTSEAYALRKAEIDALDERRKKTAGVECVTADGVRVTLAGNTESVQGCGRVAMWGGDGIKLIRTENMFADRLELPSEDEQNNEYSRARGEFRARAPQGKKECPLRFRFIDVGRDKVDYPWLKKLVEKDEVQLGGIDFLLAHRDVFKRQSRALLRSGAEEAMIPMIQNRGQLDDALAVIREAKGELKSEGKMYNEGMRVGVMVETPSAAMSLAALREGVDFWSIGTNDLAHYVLSKPERQDQPDRDPYVPTVFHTINRVIHAGVVNGMPTGVCGDMAGTKLGALTLVGMYELAREDVVEEQNVRVSPELSMVSHNIPDIKEVLCKVKASDLKDAVRDTLKKSDPEKTNAPLKNDADVIRHLRRKLAEKGIEA